MKTEDLIARYPRVFHMAADESWPSIQTRGLLTTRKIVELCQPQSDVANSILAQRRPKTLTLTTPEGEQISVRDQKPLQPHNLKLVDTDHQGWLDLLNGRVFFWVDEDHLKGLLRARAYRTQAHHVLTVDTAELVHRHGGYSLVRD